MKTIALLLLMTSAASAQVVYQFPSCVVNSPDGTVTAFTSEQTYCQKVGGVFSPSGLIGSTQVIPQAGSVTVTATQPKCPDGWTLVATPSPMCAHELRDPE